MRHAVVSPKNILVIDEQPLVFEAIRSHLDRQYDEVMFDYCRRPFDCEHLKNGFYEGLIIIDIYPHCIETIKFLDQLRRFGSQALVLIFTACAPSLYLSRCQAAGACGWVSKYADLDQLQDAVAHVMHGRDHFLKLSGDMSEYGRAPFFDSGIDVSLLTPRELEVFQHFGMGLCTKEVACQLNISVKTIESHIENIRVKLGFQSGREMCFSATRLMMAHQFELSQDFP